MSESLVSFGIVFSLIGIFFSAVVSLFKNSFKASSALLVISTLGGFFSGLGYLINFSGKEMVVADFSVLFGASLRLNFLAGIFLTLILGISSLTAVYGSEYLERYRKTYNLQIVQFMTSLFVLGMAGVLLSGNALLFMFFWEVMSVASFFLVLSDKTKESVRAAFIYFAMTHLGAAAILGGFLILGGGSLTLNFGDFLGVQKNISSAGATVAFLLFLFGFGSKAGLIPFHIWLPSAHPQAPTNISALMSGLMLKIAVYGFLKVVFVFSGLPSWTAWLVVVLGISSALFGALYAAIARDIKRALAYSSIENMGIVFTMLGVALFVNARPEAASISPLAVSLVAFALFHALNHAIFKTGLFLSSGVIVSKFHSRSLEAMGGLAKVMPFFSFSFLVIILAAAALPPFGAFYGEWGFIRALVEILGNPGVSAFSLAALLLVLSVFSLASGLAIFAMIKIFSISMLGLPRTEIHEISADQKDSRMIFPIAVLGVAMMLSGIFAKSILDYVSRGFGAISASVSIPGVAISSPKVFGIFIFLLALSFGLYKLFSKNEGKTREYRTWDCGQPIDSSMEYTATAFSAPIRFFLLSLVQRNKVIVATPLEKANPWIVKKAFAMTLTSVWQEKFYKPGLQFVFWLADKIRLIHSGRIQYYLLMLLITIVLTLMIAL